MYVEGQDESVGAELGISENAADAEQDGNKAEKKGANQTGDGERKEDTPTPSGSKNAKKKKNNKDNWTRMQWRQRKHKNAMEAKEAQVSEEAASAEPEEDTAVDVKERLKKTALMMKKKLGKEKATAAAKIATAEAAARTARLVAAKKKPNSQWEKPDESRCPKRGGVVGVVKAVITDIIAAVRTKKSPSTATSSGGRGQG
ncbi:DNA ligase 1 [Hordeum vulgare]|nr:DNA ligase 1 [Hordeum vulgare]